MFAGFLRESEGKKEILRIKPSWKSGTVRFLYMQFFFLILCKRLTLLLVAGVLCKDLCLLVVAEGDVWRCVLWGLLLAFWSCCSPAAGAVAGGPCSPHVLGSSCGIPQVGWGGVSVGFWVPGDFLGIFLVFG